MLAALAITAATTVITGCAHALGGGAAPDALLLATAFVLTLVLLTPVVGSSAAGAVGTVRQAVAIAAAQLLQHVLYSLPATDAAGGQGHAAHVHDASAALPSAELASAEVTGAELARAAVHEHASMPLAHLAAGLLTLALLRHAPRAVARLLAAVAPRLAAIVLTWAPGPVARPASVVPARPAQRPAFDVVREAVVTRGPPLARV